MLDTDNDYSFINEHVFAEPELKNMKSGFFIQKFIRIDNIEWYDSLNKSIVRTNADIYPELYPDIFPEINNPIDDSLTMLEIVSKQKATKRLLFVNTGLQNFCTDFVFYGSV